MSPAAEPAVVQNKAFNANVSGAGCQFFQLCDIMVEIHRFPRVIMHRPRLEAHRWPQQFCAHMFMEFAAQRAQPIGAICRNNFGAHKGFTWFQPNLAGQQERTKAGQHASIGQRVHTQAMVPAPRQMEAIGFARSFVRAGRRQ